jgi:competence protein ComEC
MSSFIKNYRTYVLGMLLLAAVFAGYAVYVERQSDLTVSFLDVGQGDAILINTSQHQQILIDGGSGKAVLRELSKVMPFYDRSIDAVIATHPDADHIGGLPDVLSNYEVGIVMEPGVESDTSIYKEFEKIIREKNIKKILARRGMRIELSDGAYLLILFPDRDMTGSDSNDASIVAKLVYGDTSFLFTGDSPKKIESYLISTDAGSLDSDVLKAGHHGSKTSSSQEFVAAVSPEYAVISVGKDNKYGHPNQETLDTFKNFGSQILRTDLLGTIDMSSDGTGVIFR